MTATKRGKVMSRGSLDDSDLAEIHRQLPDLEALWKKTGALNPEIISARFPHESSVPTASVCFHDAYGTLAEARYAVHEYHAHKVWYRERVSPPRELEAVFFERYYLDDAGLRLYAAGEHLASGIIAMLEITKDALPKSRTSLQARLGRYLSETDSAPASVSTAVSTLRRSREWCETIKYRNRWVHDQPPRVQGLGISFSRKRRWRTTTSGASILAVSGGDEPDCNTASLAGFISGALGTFSSTLHACVDHYIEMLKSAGITLNSNGDLEVPLC